MVRQRVVPRVPRRAPFGGLGILATGSSNRFTDNYLDCNALYLRGVIDTDVQNTFFLSWANIVIAPGGEIPGEEGRIIHGCDQQTNQSTNQSTNQ